MKQPGGLPRKSFHKRFVQRQRETVIAAEAFRRAEEERRGQEAAQGDGPGGGEWVDGPSHHGSQRAHEEPPLARRPRPSSRAKQIVQGQVRDVRSYRSPHWIIGGEQVSTVTFRVEGFDDRANQAWLIPATMSGSGAEGFLHDGDWVRMRGRFRLGILEATQIVNVDNGSEIRAPGGGRIVQKVVWTLSMLLLIAIAAGIVAGLFFGWRPPGFDLFDRNTCPPPEFPAQPPGCPAE